MRYAVFIVIFIVSLSVAYAQHGDGSAYTVGPAWHWLQDIYSANGVRADDNNDGAIDRANHLLTAGGYSRLFSPVAGSAVLRIEGGAGQYSAIDFYSGGAASWGMGRNIAGNFYIDRAGGAVPAVFISSANQFVGINTNAPVEQLTVAGRISAQPPNSGDDVVTRDYADTNYVNEGQANSVTSVMIVDNTITSADIYDGTITSSDIDLSNLDARYVNEGQANSITSGMITDGQVTSSDIADGGVATVDLANLAVTNAKLADASVSTGKIQDGAVTTAKIADGSVITSKIADNAVTTAKILDSAIITSKIANSAVTGIKIALDSISTNHIQNLAVTTAKLADLSVTVAKLADASVSTSKLQNLAVTNAKINDVAWEKITGVPAGFADGVDDVGAINNLCDLPSGTIIGYGYGGLVCPVCSVRICLTDHGPGSYLHCVCRKS